MPRSKRTKISRKERSQSPETQLSKGHLRKLNALKKSLGDEIAEKAFAKWYAKHGTAGTQQTDRNAGTIAEVLWQLVEAGKLRVSRKGYVVRRGRGRLLVESTTPR